VKHLALAASLLFLTAAPAYAQIAAAAAPGNHGVLQLDEHGRGVFAVVAINLGRPGGSFAPIDPMKYCGGFTVAATGAVITNVCDLDRATGACAGAAGPTVSGQLMTGEIGVYGVLVQGPVLSGRVTVTFTEYDRGTPVFPPRCHFPNEPTHDVAERGAVNIRVVP
jgi:hypothetical protein